jgi:hypothetical protein
VTRHRRDNLPRSYRPLQNGMKLFYFRYMKPTKSRWLGGDEPSVVMDTTERARTLMANFFGSRAMLGAGLPVEASWIVQNVDPELLRDVQEEMEHRIVEELRKERHVVDTGDEITWTFSVQVFATARVKGWPDAVPGLTGIPWQLTKYPAIKWKFSEHPMRVQSVLIPLLMRGLSEAEYGGAFRVAVLCEPGTAAYARHVGLHEYVTLVEDERQPRGIFRIAEEV